MNTAIAHDFRTQAPKQPYRNFLLIPKKVNQEFSNNEVKVLFQNIGGKCYAFSSNGDVFHLESEK